jgi:SAM-dependent methyltransferase
MSVGNPFESEAAARRYVTGRLFYHDKALELAFARLGRASVGVAVDLGCGTGLSTRALRRRADRIIAADISKAILREAPAGPLYAVASAERIPVRDAVADLVTVGAAFHWFNQPKVFAELARVLRPGGALAVYTDFFHGRLPAEPAFAEWFTTTYRPRFPSPPRNATFDPPAATAAGFADVTEAQQEIVVPLTRDQLVAYLLSQSNALAAIDSGATTAAEMEADLTRELAPAFPTGPAEVTFGIRVWTTTLAH